MRNNFGFYGLTFTQKDIDELDLTPGVGKFFDMDNENAFVQQLTKHIHDDSFKHDKLYLLYINITDFENVCLLEHYVGKQQLSFSSNDGVLLDIDFVANQFEITYYVY